MAIVSDTTLARRPFVGAHPVRERPLRERYGAL